MTNPEQFHWQRQSGQKVFAQTWVPAQVLGVVALVHGLGEHSGRYGYVAQRLNDANLAVIALDLPGHGQTEGKRGVASFDECFTEIDHLLEESRRRFPGKPIFYYGHSMGAALGLRYILQRKPTLKGAIITSPPLAKVSVSPLKYNLARYLSRLTPFVSLKNGLEQKHLSRDARVIAAYAADPLVHKFISSRLAWDLLSSGQWIQEHAGRWSLPLLLVHGTQDQICRYEGSQDFYKRTPATLVTLKLWEGLYHETHNEPEKDQVLSYTLNWIAQQQTLENGILSSAL